MISSPSILKPAAGPLAIQDLRMPAQRLWIDCVLAWPFWSIGQHHVEDVGPNKFHGVMGTGISPATDWTGSPYGGALLFNTNSFDKLTVADPPNNQLDGFAAFSVEVIFRSTTYGASGTQYGLVGKYRPLTGARAWRLYIDGDELALQTSGDGVGNEVMVTTNANLVANTWYQAIVTFAAGVWSVRLNGSILTTDGNFMSQLSAFACSEEFKVGQRTTAGAGADTVLSGEIASVRVWSRALNVDETRQLYEDPWGMYDAGLGLPSLALLHSGGSTAAGAWMEAGVVQAGVQALLIGGLMNGMSYDVRLKTRDLTGNTSAGDTPGSATPVAGSVAKLPIHLRAPAAGGVLRPTRLPWPW